MSEYHPESRFWLSNHFLNCVTSGRYKLPFGAFVAAFLRRAEASFKLHKLAREATYELLGLRQPSPSHYGVALTQWEGFLTQSYQGIALIAKMIQTSGNPDFKAFEPNDGSMVQRFNLVYNSLKHVEKRIAAGQMLPDAITPVWLSSLGLECIDAVITYDETAEFLRIIADWADVLVNPREFPTKIQKLQAGSLRFGT